MHSGPASFWVKVSPGFFETVVSKKDMGYAYPHFPLNPSMDRDPALHLARQLLKPWVIIHPYEEKRNPRYSGQNA